MTWVRFVDMEVPAGRRRSRRRVVSGYVLEPRATALRKRRPYKEAC